MDLDSSQQSPGVTPEQDPAPATERNEDQSRERVAGSDLMVTEGDLVGFDKNKVGMSQILDQIHEVASRVLQFTLEWEEVDKQYTTMENLLKERTMEVELKERSAMERIVESEKKEERLKEVEERERNIGVTETSMTVRLEEKEKENETKRYLESLVMRSFCEKPKEELDKRGQEVERLSKLNDDKSCELERTMTELDVVQKYLIETRRKEAELLEKSRKQLEAKEKELMLLDEALKEKANELEKKEAIFEVEKKAKAEELELKSKLLELTEQKLEQGEKELQVKKQRELEERSIQAQSCKRSRVKLLARKGSETDSFIRPAKKQKTLGEQIENEEKDTDSAYCVVPASAPSFVQTNEAQEAEIDEAVSRGDKDEDPDHLNCADSEFHDFSKTMSSFVVGKVWALYDPVDEMPRLYAKIKRVIRSLLSLQVKWAEPRDEESLPVACGRFKYRTTETVSHLMFSHEMHRITHGRKFIAVNPRKGETWALFSDWRKSWNNNTEQYKPPYRYDLVEVLLKFSDHIGIGVAYLGKVEGFVSVFEHAAHNGVFQLMIPPEEMHRFSHRVPSIRLNGDEKEGVPAGSFELDPAAVPSYILLGEKEADVVQVQDGSGKDVPIVID